MKCELVDIVSSIQTGPFGSQLHRSDYTEEGTPVIMPQDIVNWQLSTEKISRIPEEHVIRLQRHKVEYNDIIYPRRGDVSKCAIVDKEVGWICGTGCLKVKINQLKANPKYIFYYLQQPHIGKWIELHSTGATMMNINSSTLNALPLDLPSHAVQDKIISFISAYDDLIDNCRKQIALLEEAAQRLYREWFVDFRFPGHETTPIGEDGLPQGWSKDEAISFFPNRIFIGKTPSRQQSEYFSRIKDGNIIWSSVSDLNKSNTFIYDSTEYITKEAANTTNIRIIPKGSILVSFKLTVGRTAIAANMMTSNEAIAHFIMSDEEREYIYLYLSNFEYSTLGSTSSIGTAVNSKVIKSMPIVYPTDDIIEAFHHIVYPIFKRIEIMGLQCNKLISARDSLLPKLMSGELKI